MSNRDDFENMAREYYQRHHMSETPHPRDVKALETELRNAYVAGQEAELIAFREGIEQVIAEIRRQCADPPLMPASIISGLRILIRARESSP
jgi:hypothetical protein